ncbi:MAG: nucleoside 2-deoxyribosyltransferase [Methanoregulaceae archaeon]|nr:nucleoside 2-deoxyribosyltransferase [Methanoregulaceae archaeon]
MYVLVCPCILDPTLRARGITTDKDLDLFSRVKTRCEMFSIEMVALPCPETIYAGRDREPGYFLGRLDNPEFSAVMVRIEQQTRKIIEDRGPPLCIIGVDSSPTCGVNRTWYGSVDGGDARREGRGVFLARFPEIKAFDVADFARYRVYLAAPLFSEAEKSYNIQIRDLLSSHFCDVYLPQEIGDDTHARSRDEHQRIYERHVEALAKADFVIAVVDGADADSGTAWEMGYAVARGIPVIALRTDFRMAGLQERVNLMLEQSAYVITDKNSLPEAIRSPRRSPSPGDR